MEVASEILICLDRLALLAFNVSFVDVGFISECLSVSYHRLHAYIHCVCRDECV